MGMTTFSGPVRSLAGFITGADAYIPQTATPVVLSPADNGKTIVLAIPGAGGLVTLPAANAENVGLTYNFSFSANAVATLKIRTATYASAGGPGNDVYNGSVYIAAAGGSPLLFLPNGTTDDVINLGGVTGGQAGSTMSVICTAVNKWTVSGNLISSGAPTTPFAGT
jgi:hypothetical protein